MSKLIDITRQKFGRLTVIKRAENTKLGESRWVCKCECGNEKIIRGRKLRTASTQSCGCIHKEYARRHIYEISKKYNTYDLSGEYGIGYTSKGEQFYFDLEDYEKIKEVCWHVTKSKYIRGLLNGKSILQHVFILNKPKKMTIDHINHNTVDNRKENLRICSIQQNCMNRQLYNSNKSGYSGVIFRKDSKKWRACITYKYKIIQLGTFTNMQDAINARKKAEEKYFGEFAYKGNKE